MSPVGMPTTMFHNTYRVNVRIGNWCEDKARKEQALQEYLQKQDKNQLHSLQYYRSLSAATRPISMSPPETANSIQYGQLVQIQHDHHQCCLAIHFLESIGQGPAGVESAEYALYASSSQMSPCVRNVFRIYRYDEQKPFEYEKQKGSVCFGDKVLLMPVKDNGFINESCISSRVKCTNNLSNQSGWQSVQLAEEMDYESVWEIMFPDANYRLEYEGIPIQLQETFVLGQPKTGHAMIAQQAKQRNTMGDEYNVYCCKLRAPFTAQTDYIWKFHIVGTKENSSSSDGVPGVQLN